MEPHRLCGAFPHIQWGSGAAARRCCSTPTWTLPVDSLCFQRNGSARPLTWSGPCAPIGRLGHAPPGWLAREVNRYEHRQSIEVLPRSYAILWPLVDLKKVIIEIEDPDIPIGHEVELEVGGFGVGV